MGGHFIYGRTDLSASATARIGSFLARGRGGVCLCLTLAVLLHAKPAVGQTSADEEPPPERAGAEAVAASRTVGFDVDESLRRVAEREANRFSFGQAMEDLVGPRHLLEGGRRALSQENLAILGAGLVLGSIAIAEADDAVYRYFHDGGRLEGLTPVLNEAGKRRNLYPATVATYLIGHLVEDRKVVRIGSEMTRALVLTDLVVTAGKFTAGRRRPDRSNKQSFPSGHSAGFFTIATVLERNFGVRAAVPAYTLATLMGVSRIDGNHHFLSDVVVGAAIGIVMGRSISGELADRGISVGTVRGPDGATGLGFTLDF